MMLVPRSTRWAGINTMLGPGIVRDLGSKGCRSSQEQEENEDGAHGLRM
jgi:hypothetical protein